MQALAQKIGFLQKDSLLLNGTTGVSFTYSFLGTT